MDTGAGGCETAGGTKTPGTFTPGTGIQKTAVPL
ncbi:hypothetical protein DBN75_02405 [Enterococcus faecalis]|nr:hypothetical protein [Enterococcus faecium]NRD91249.1 hypothetical protein [Enterococcus faecalis]NRD96023.1 hypothetical protein [Enterococcus faecalis]NRE28750.1 hypothetical protein [Enterococcus faecalis]NRE36468.1 hypothetical protein [Enterococcus faecalis]